MNTSLLHVFWVIFSHGGWLVFVPLFFWLAFKIYMNEINTNFKKSIQWTYLEIKPPKENISSFANAEQIFVQLHILFDNYNFQEKYIDGRLVFWMSLEIVSLGGKISYMIRIPTKHREVIEAAFYANYPHIEMHEVNDYLANFNYDPDSDKYDLFGADFVLVDKESVPLRTYRDFISQKGPDASEKVVDPLAPMLEVFTRLHPKELYAFQMVIQPVADASWKDEANAVAEKLADGKPVVELDDITKLRIAAVKAKLGKVAFRTKMRILHLGSKDVFNADAKKLVLSPFKVFNSANFNGLKPAFSTKLDWRISQTLEAPFINYWVRQRKINIFNGFKDRSTWVGEPGFILNTEELATIFHFPITEQGTIAPAAVETVDIRKVAPPANLPI